MNSDVPKILRKIPGLGERRVDKELARAKLQEANGYYQAGTNAQGQERKELLRKAAASYIEAGKNWASSSLEQDAHYMAAESYFFAEDYPKAEDYYVKLIKEYPRTRYQDRVDQRRMEIGNYWLQFPDKFYNVNWTDKTRPWNDTQNHGKRDSTMSIGPIKRGLGTTRKTMANGFWKKCCSIAPPDAWPMMRPWTSPIRSSSGRTGPKPSIAIAT